MTPSEIDAMWHDWQETLLHGQGSASFVERWGKRAFPLFVEKSATGDAQAFFLLAKCYELGIAVPASDTKAFDHYKQSAEAGFVWAMLNLADCFEFGLGVEANPRAAIDWITRATTIEPSCDNYFQLASIYSRLADQSLGTANKVKYLRTASDLGHLEAKAYLAAHLWNEDLTRAEQLEGCQLMEQAAQAGHATAQNDLAVAYQFGKWPIERDVQKAIDWYRRSADQNCATGCHNLGQCYFNGWGIDKDLKQAVLWITKAAEQDLASAQYDLAMIYLFHFPEPELGLNQSIPWLHRAVQNGLSEHAELLETLERTNNRNKTSSDLLLEAKNEH